MRKQERRQLLRESGFIRIDGLFLRGQVVGGYLSSLEPNELGKWDNNGGVCAVVTVDRELWIRYSGEYLTIQGDEEILEALALLTPNGKGVFNSYTEENLEFSGSDLLARVADPDYEPKVLAPF